MQLTTKQNQIAEQFIKLTYEGMAALVAAGKLIASEIDLNGDGIIDEICHRNPVITRGFIKRIAESSRLTTYAELMIGDQPGVKALLKAPVSLQDKHVHDPIPVLVLDGTGYMTLLISIYNLTSAQTAQVFDGESIRDEAGQRAYIESKRTAASMVVAPKPSAEPFRLRKGKIQWSPDFEFTPKEILALITPLL